MAIPPWALDTLMRGIHTVVDKVPPEAIDQLRQRANRLLDELPESAARGVDNVFRGARATKQMLQRWSQQHLALVTPVINGSGRLVDERLDSIGLADPLIEWASGMNASPLLRGGSSDQRLQRRLQRCAGGSDYDLLVATSVEAACLAVGLAGGERPVYFHRSQAHRLPSGTAVPDAFQCRGDGQPGGVSIHEIGSVDGVATSDSAGLPGGATLVAVDHGDSEPLWYNANPAAGPPTDAWRVVLMTLCGGVAGGEGLAEPNWLSGVTPRPRLAVEHLGSGADLVITPGEGLLGGPPCGLIVGRRERIERLRTCPAWRALRASTVEHAMMAMALQSLQGTSFPQHPVALALTTSEENLKHRAERLAIRLTAAEQVATVQITADPASLTSTGVWRVASRQLRIRHRDRSAADWSRELLDAFPAVLTGHADDSLVIDLRWVRPADDAALASALVGDFDPVRTESPAEAAPSDFSEDA